MKTKQQIQERIEELEKEYLKFNQEYQNLIWMSDVSNTLDNLEEQINLLKWVLKEE